MSDLAPTPCLRKNAPARAGRSAFTVNKNSVLYVCGECRVVVCRNLPEIADQRVINAASEK
jgi:hypothetical protein